MIRQLRVPNKRVLLGDSPNLPDTVCRSRTAQHEELGPPSVRLVFHEDTHAVEARL